MLHPERAVLAGSYGTWVLTYVVGSHGVAVGGQIRLHTDSDTDWGMPQIEDPTDENYLFARAPEGVRTVTLVETVEERRAVSLTIRGRRLEEGERVRIIVGDRSGGSPGSRAQTFAEPRRYFWVSVDAEGDGDFVTLPDSPHVPVVGGVPVRAVALAQSTVVVGQAFRLLVKLEDAWGNSSTTYRGTVRLQAPGVDFPLDQHAFTAEDGGVWRLNGCTCVSAGEFRIRVSDGRGHLRVQSNPILCLEKDPRYHLYWGDPHGGQLHDAAKIPDFFRYARDVAGIDFVGYQANGCRLSAGEWLAQQEAEQRYYQPGRFVPLPGFEWSAKTKQGGHHNVYFRRQGQPIRRSRRLDVAHQPRRDTDLPDIRDVYQAYRSADVLITPHVGGSVADLDYHEPTLEPALEVTSTHGTFEWFWEEALRRGYQMGIIGGSDGYTGRPGAEYPGYQERRYAKGGLTGLYASELNIEGVHEALKARRVYATTGARILVRVDGDGRMMGEEYRTTSPPRICASVAGTASLQSVELFRGRQRVYSHALDLSQATDRIGIFWEGASRRSSYSGVMWNGTLTAVRGEMAVEEEIRFDSPRSRVFDVSDVGLRWHSVACGYRSGFVIRVAGGEDADFWLTMRLSLLSSLSSDGLRMSYAPAERLGFGFSIHDLAAGPIEMPIGAVNCRLMASLAPEPGGSERAEFSFVDPSPVPGVNAYWLRVTQTDGEMAWTSPVFADYVATV